MVTRAQLIRQSVVSVSHNPNSPSWYLNEDFWDFILNVLGIAADVLRFAEKPVAAATLERVVTIAQKRAVTLKQEDLRAAATMKLHVLSKQLKVPSKHTDPLVQARINAQLDVLADLLHDTRSNHGEES